MNRDAELSDLYGQVVDLRADNARLTAALERRPVGQSDAMKDPDRLELLIEQWAHDRLDDDYRPTPNATMRWQLCQRPHHPEDDDCACCLMSPEEAAGMVGTDCGCICHERIRSLAEFLAAALTPGGTP